MRHGIKLVSLSVQHVGTLTGRVDVGPFSGGLNVISGRNEAGKSTLVEALRVLCKDDRPLPLILDDTMGWTDDWRFLSMVQILRDAAREMQIILLTCHPARFGRFQAEYTVDLDRARGTASPEPESIAALRAP